VLLTLVNESREEIEAAGVMTDLLRFPGEPVRRWFDRRVLRDVLNEVRNTDPIGDKVREGRGKPLLFNRR
ncbi:hypothetical protein ABG75_25770, partial [Salmonella enterica]|nr:hypothetical protein [Salmonella enterica]